MTMFVILVIFTHFRFTILPQSTNCTEGNTQLQTEKKNTYSKRHLNSSIGRTGKKELGKMQMNQRSIFWVTTLVSKTRNTHTHTVNMASPASSCNTHGCFFVFLKKRQNPNYLSLHDSSPEGCFAKISLGEIIQQTLVWKEGSTSQQPLKQFKPTSKMPSI